MKMQTLPLDKIRLELIRLDHYNTCISITDENSQCTYSQCDNIELQNLVVHNLKLDPDIKLSVKNKTIYYLQTNNP